MDIDDCYNNVVGTFGRFQAWVFCLNVFTTFLLCPQTFLVVFIGSTPSELNETNSRVNNQSLILIEWDLMERKWIEDVIQSIYFVGFLFGVIIFGQLSDRFGRRIVLLAGFHCLFPVCFMASFAYSWQTFAACRFLTGFLLGGASLVQYVYTQEMLGRKWWAYTGFTGSLFFGFGIVLISVVAFYVTPWRTLTRLISAFQIVPILCMWSCTESPRWLYSKGRLVEAEILLMKIAKRNGVKKPVISLIKKVSQETKVHYTLIDLLKNKVTRKRVLILAYLWFVNSLVYYALSLAASDVSKNLYLNEAMQGLIEAPAILMLAVTINKSWCGRKRVLSGSFLLSGACCLAIMAIPNAAKSAAKMVLALSGKMMIAISFSAVYIYTPELFPTVVRNVAMGSLSMCSRVGGIAASFSKSLIAYNALCAYFLFGFSGLTAGLLTLLLPETLGLNPPDSFEDLWYQSQAKADRKETKNVLELLSCKKQRKTDEDRVKLLVPSGEGNSGSESS